MSVSVAVMAHPRRARWIPALLDALDTDDAQVVWDRRNDRHDTGLRCLQAHDPDAAYHLVIQDDVVVCRDLVAACGKAARYAGGRPVALFSSRAQERRALVRRAGRAAQLAGSPWFESPDAVAYGQAMLLPVADLPALTAWYRTSTVENHDTRVAAWYRQQGVAWLFTHPSLVDHRDEQANPSLVVEAVTGKPRRGRGRTAIEFLGRERSALTLDWSASPVGPPPPVTLR